MKAMVLAAGRGERLRPLTDSIPKPMIPVAGRPVLEHVVRLLARHGFDQIAINLHHMPDAITGYFGDGRDFGVEIIYSREEEMLGTAGAVRRLSTFFDQRFLVYYGDNLMNVDLSELWHGHECEGVRTSIGLAFMDDPTSRGIVQLDDNSRVTRFVEKPGVEEIFDDYHVNAGVYVLEPSIIDLIPPDSVYDFARDLFPRMLADGASIHGHRLVGQVLSTDTPERYENTRRLVSEGVFSLP